MIWVVGVIVGALVACIGMSAQVGLSAKKEVIDLTINSLGQDLRKGELEELKDMRKSIRNNALLSRVVFTCMWWGGVILFGVALYMLTH